ncbi:hypothetical protein VVS316_04210 [Vibrio vulnificus]|nr:hypothetical protein VVS316_04210 [Vibrio vulnificus]
MKQYRKLVGVFVATLIMSGCANMSAGNLFSHYSEQNRSVYQAVKSGDYAQAQELQSGGVAGDILDNMEKGRIAFLSADYPESKKALEASDVAVRKWQDLAKVSLSQTATSVGSLAVNDNLNNYTPADYELGFLHLYLGLNYLQQNSLEGALVEMRRANQVQEAAQAKSTLFDPFVQASTRHLSYWVQISKGQSVKTISGRLSVICKRRGCRLT